MKFRYGKRERVHFTLESRKGVKERQVIQPLLFLFSTSRSPLRKNKSVSQVRGTSWIKQDNYKQSHGRPSAWGRGLCAKMAGQVRSSISRESYWAQLCYPRQTGRRYMYVCMHGKGVCFRGQFVYCIWTGVDTSESTSRSPSKSNGHSAGNASISGS